MEKISPIVEDGTKDVKDVRYNVLDEPVKQKAQAPLVNTEGADMANPIPEATFTPPPKMKPTPPPPPKPEPVNPDIKNLPKKDVEMAASQMANMILTGYEWFHGLANKGLMISERKLHKLQQDGEINLNAMIDYEYGKKIRAGDFFEEFNKQQQNNLTVSDEFKEEVRPVLERVLAKRGIGLTDEQTLIFLFGKDIAIKSLQFFQSKNQINYMIESIKQATTNQFAQAAPTPTPAPAATTETEEKNYSEPEERDKKNESKPQPKSKDSISDIIVIE